MGARPKIDYTEIDERLASGKETPYKIAKELGIRIPTMYAHWRTRFVTPTRGVLEKLGNPTPKHGAWGRLYLKEGSPSELYEIVDALTNEVALRTLGKIVLYESTCDIMNTPISTIVAGSVSMSPEVEVALKEYGIKIAKKEEL